MLASPSETLLRLLALLLRLALFITGRTLLAVTGNMVWLVTVMAQAVLHIVGILLIRKSCRQLGLGRTSRTTTRSLALSTHRLGRLRSLALGQTCLNSRPLKSCILSDGIECCPTLTHRISAAHLLQVRLEPSSIPLDLDTLVSDLITKINHGLVKLDIVLVHTLGPLGQLVPGIPVRLNGSTETIAPDHGLAEERTRVSDKRTRIRTTRIRSRVGCLPCLPRRHPKGPRLTIQVGRRNTQILCVRRCIEIFLNHRQPLTNVRPTLLVLELRRSSSPCDRVGIRSSDLVLSTAQSIVQIRDAILVALILMSQHNQRHWSILKRQSQCLSSNPLTISTESLPVCLELRTRTIGKIRYHWRRWWRNMWNSI